MSRASRRMLVLAGLITVLVLAAAPTAMAAAPTLSAVTPADGARFTGGFAVTFSATDPDTLNGSAARVVVGSTAYTPTVAYAGFWDGDGCESWWAEDRSSASFTCAIPDPGPGVHTVTITVPDATGETATRSISVTRTAAITFSGHSPVSGGRYQSANRFSVLASGADVSAASVSMNMDGASVPVSTSIVAPGVVLIEAQQVCAPGVHSLSVSVGDGTSAPPAVTEWSFTVDPLAAPPLISAQQPADGSTLEGPFTITYRVSDPNGINGANARLAYGGRVLPATVTYAGYWTDDGCETWWVEDRTLADLSFAIPDLAPGEYEFRFEVADASGNWAVRTTTLLRSAHLAATGQTPAPASRVRSTELLGVTVTGGQLDPASATMTVDGMAVVPEVTLADDGGRITYPTTLGEGSHTVRVTVSDTLGSPPISTEWSFVVDASAPVVDSVTPPDGAVSGIADGGVEVRVRDADGVDAASVSLSIDGVAVPSSFASDAAGATVRWSGVLAEGAHSASVALRDLAGNELAHSWAFSVADPPRFGAIAPFGAISPEDVTVSAAVFDVNDALDPAVNLVVDGVAVPATLVSSGTGSGTIESHLTGLADGLHTAVATVRDAAGNEASKSWSFRVDAVGPAIGSRSPSASSTLGAHLVAVAATFNDASAISPSTAAAWLDGAPVTLNAANAVRWVGSGCDAYEEIVPGTLYVSGTLALGDGPHTLRVRVADAFGHETIEEWSFTVAEYPAVKSVLPVPGTHTKEPGLALSASIGDYDGIASTGAAWRRSGESVWQPLVSSFDPTTGVLGASFTFPNGDTGYEFSLSATDVGGLTTTVTTSAFIDGSGPAFDQAAARPLIDAVLVARQVAFRARFTDASTIDPSSAMASIDGEPVAVTSQHEVRWVGSGCDAYEEEIPGTLVVSGISQLHDGAHSVTISAADQFGFRTTRAWTFSVQEPPAIVGLTPAAGSRTTENGIAVAATVTDYDGIASATITWREANVGRPAGEWQTAAATYDSASGLLRTDVTFPRDDTRYEFKVTAVDTGGLSSSAIGDVFASSSAEQILAGSDCLSCHSAALQSHPMSNCTACHGSPQGPCDCHGSGAHPASWMTGVGFYDHGGDYTGRTCVDCHSHVADVEAQRHGSGLGSECSSCHEQALTAEHAGILVNGEPFTCSTCHESADSGVVAAIAGNRTECVACHALGGEGHNGMHEGTLTSGNLRLFENHENIGPIVWTVQCTLCHATAQLLTIHASDCEVCHAGATPPADSFPAWSGTCQQGACHATIPHDRADAAHTAVANSNCEACHQPDWSVPYSACDGCHSPATAAPVTTSDLRSSYTGAAPIHFSASGIAWTFYRLDGGPRVSGTGLVVPAPASGAASHTIEFWSVSDAGVEELPHRTASFSIGVDVMAPNTTSNAASSYVGPAVVTLAVTDDNASPVAGTYWRLDGGAVNTGTTVSFAQPTSGSVVRTLEFWSVDAAGNEELPHKSAVFTHIADTVAPTTTSNAPAYDKTTTQLLVTLFRSDPVPSSGIAATYRSVDGGPMWQLTWCTISTQGVHTIRYWSTDKAGNVEAAKVQTVVKDWTAPVTTSNALASYTASAGIHLAATDNVAGVQTTYYVLDAGAQQSGTDVTVTGTGAHTLAFWSVDRAGNVESQKTVAFTIN